jgi:uncharacterized membrane protein YphA (DoxX/SURF4 family)
MNGRRITYWIATALIAFVFLSGGIVDVIRPHFALDGMAHLGYPAYFCAILGVWKVLGGLVVLSPGTPRLKEWAYAGMFFDVTGASASHFSVHDPAIKVAMPLIIACIVATSWALRPAGRKLAGPAL